MIWKGFGRRKRHYQEWRTDEGYRITWYDQFMGVRVTPRFTACVRAVVNDRAYWEFVGRRGPYRKYSAAIKACEKHYKVWSQALDLNKAALRALDERARAGSGVTTGRILAALPVWAKPVATKSLLKYISHENPARLGVAR